MTTRPQKAASRRQQKLTELILYIISQPDDWIDGALAETREQQRLSPRNAPVGRRQATLRFVPNE